jgi:hypothetical protein
MDRSGPIDRLIRAEIIRHALSQQPGPLRARFQQSAKFTLEPSFA